MDPKSLADCCEPADAEDSLTVIVVERTDDDKAAEHAITLLSLEGPGYPCEDAAKAAADYLAAYFRHRAERLKPCAACTITKADDPDPDAVPLHSE